MAKMRMTRFGVKPEFDRGMDFIAVRPFTCAGIKLTPGQKFDKTTTTARTLRQLYDLGNLTMKAPEEPKRVRLPKRVEA